MSHHRKRRRAQRKTDGTTTSADQSMQRGENAGRSGNSGSRSGRGRRRRARRQTSAPEVNLKNIEATTEAEKQDPQAQNNSPKPQDPGARRNDNQRKPRLSEEEIQARKQQREQELEKAPFIALTIKTSGIHPSTARMITVDAVTLDPQGNPVDEYHCVLDPGNDPGPVHLHGLTHEEVKEGKRFSQILKQLGRLIDGRTLIVHHAPYTWGFIVSEARQAMSQAARANRSRSKQRGRRRQRVGHIPKPVAIVDTLATARRQGGTFTDTRIRSVAGLYGIDTVPAAATVERAQAPESVVAREETTLVAQLYFAQAENITNADTEENFIAKYDPQDLRPDRFGLQRSELRVDATAAPRTLENPGVYTEELGLVEGMEIVISPEIAMDPDILIEAIMRTNLAYSEKITRKSSAVICNKTEDHVGKAMHATRKNIPLLTDKQFMKSVEKVSAGTPVARAK